MTIGLCPAWAESTSPEFLEAIDFLTDQGYPPNAYQLLFAWNEAAPNAPAEKIYGYRLFPRSTGKAFDRYAYQNRLLNDQECAALGVIPKDWDSPLLNNAEACAFHPADRSAKAARPAPFSIQFDVKPSGQITLPELPLEKMREEDQKQLLAPDKDAPRIGVFQDFPVAVDLCGGSANCGDWTVLPDGAMIWAASIVAPGALGQRLQFTELTLPPGGQITVFNPSIPEEVHGPFTRFSPNDTELWTPTCFGEQIIVECYLPPQADPVNVCLRIPRIAHMYRSIFETALEKTGNCNLDVTCYPEWADTALGIGGLGIISSPNVLFCTCTLLADRDDCTDIPYVLTANHCVRGQTGSRGASSLEVYWLYQTNDCQGSLPALSSRPRTTGGADYLAGMTGTGFLGGGNDFTLLRLHNTPPADITRIGWTTALPTMDTPVAVIHHPSGSYKRISFGQLSDFGNLFPQYYHEVFWEQGITEPGSSGCPLLRSDSHQIIGQLWGGLSSCSLFDEPDFFGRFDLTYSIVQAYLNPPQVTVENTAHIVAEFAHEIVIPVKLSIPARESGAAISVRTVSGSAKAGYDFKALDTTLYFNSGQSQANIAITLLPDTTHEPDESFSVLLENPTCSALNNQSLSITITLRDDDPDADGDGLSDYDEIHGVCGYVSDPNRPDSDNDGLTDYEEACGIRGYFTNPSNPDSDGDGISDFMEILLGMNPLDPSDKAEMPSIAIPSFIDHRTK